MWLEHWKWLSQIHYHHQHRHWAHLCPGPLCHNCGNFQRKTFPNVRGKGRANFISENCTNKSPRKYCGSPSNDKICLNFVRKPTRKRNWQLLKMITDVPDNSPLAKGAGGKSRCVQALGWQGSVQTAEKWHRCFCSLARAKHHIWRRSPGWHQARRLSCLLYPHPRTSINSGHHEALWKMLKTGQYDPQLRRLITGEWLN